MSDSDVGVTFDEWRENREPGWYRDIGYALQEVVQSHRYDYNAKGIKPNDPGWHECSCGQWQGYWSAFEPHIADCLRALVVRRAAPPDPLLEELKQRVALRAKFYDEEPDDHPVTRGRADEARATLNLIHQYQNRATCLNDHDAVCCTDCATHSSPHKGCILR